MAITRIWAEKSRMVSGCRILPFTSIYDWPVWCFYRMNKGTMNPTHSAHEVGEDQYRDADPPFHGDAGQQWTRQIPPLKEYLDKHGWRMLMVFGCFWIEIMSCRWSTVTVDNLWNDQTEMIPVFRCMLGTGRSCGECMRMYGNFHRETSWHAGNPRLRQLISLVVISSCGPSLLAPAGLSLLAPGMLFGTSGRRHVGLHWNRGSEMWSSGHLPTGCWQRERPGRFSRPVGCWIAKAKGPQNKPLPMTHLQNHPKSPILWPVSMKDTLVEQHWAGLRCDDDLGEYGDLVQCFLDFPRVYKSEIQHDPKILQHGDDVPWFSHTIWPFLEEHEKTNQSDNPCCFFNPSRHCRFGWGHPNEIP